MSWFDRSRFKESPKPFPYSISMLSWGYNEEENIEEFLGKARDFLESLGTEYEHILIDDASSDRTLEIATRFQKSYPRLRIITNPVNRNSGWNTRIAVHAAKTEFLFWQTVDWSYDISRLSEYLPLFRDYDVIQGVRLFDRVPAYGPLFSKIPLLRNIKVKRRSDNLMKGIVSVTNYALIRVLFGVPLVDYQNVTVYPTALAQSLELETSTSFTNPEMLLKAYWKGASLIQVPIEFIARQRGQAKGTHWKSILGSIRQILSCWWKWKILGRRPDKLKGRTSGPISSRSRRSDTGAPRRAESAGTPPQSAGPAS